LKDYKRYVLWIDYFNSALSRSDGRRVPLDRSVKDPRLDELAEAVRRLGYDPETSQAKFPPRMMLQSGYVSIEKRPNLKKGEVMDEVSKSLSAVRGERAAGSQAPLGTPPSSQRKEIPRKH